MPNFSITFGWGLGRRCMKRSIKQQVKNCYRVSNGYSFIEFQIKILLLHYLSSNKLTPSLIHTRPHQKIFERSVILL